MVGELACAAGQLAKACRCSDLPALRQDNIKQILHLDRKWNGLFQKLAICIHVTKVSKEAELLNVLEQTRNIFALTSFLQVCQELIVEGRGWLEP